ncbi:MAG: hypothetical protein QOJ27_2268 [Sphingomonadales bacterium]|nr:hypothetical protein [Sphingomonadales bacterium]
MATIAETAPVTGAGDDRFFLRAAIVMALVVAAGFSLQLAMGRSTFASPPLVHAHAIVFMGWVTLYLLQNFFVARGNMALHRRLGWIGAGWVVAMVVLGCWATAAMVRRGQVPFFFRPLHFLVFDPMIVFTFAGLTAAAIALRRRTDWHRRLHYCGMSLLIAPAFGRLLPMPMLQPWAFEAMFAAPMVFPIVGILADIRRSGRGHPAWRWGISAMILSLLLTEAITYGPAGGPLYRAVTAGSPGAAVPPLDFAAPPAGPLMTGRTS